jgi:hypothetical protein
MEGARALRPSAAASESRHNHAMPPHSNGLDQSSAPPRWRSGLAKAFGAAAVVWANGAGSRACRASRCARAAAGGGSRMTIGAPVGRLLLMDCYCRWLPPHSAVFPGMPEANDDNHGVLDFVAEFVVTHEQTTDFARLEAFCPRTEARIVPQQSRWRGAQRSHGACRGAQVHWGQEFVEAYQIGPRFSGPENPHQSGCGIGSSRSVPRLSAQVCIVASSIKRPASTSARPFRVSCRRRSAPDRALASASRARRRCRTAPGSGCVGLTLSMDRNLAFATVGCQG